MTAPTSIRDADRTAAEPARAALPASVPMALAFLSGILVAEWLLPSGSGILAGAAVLVLAAVGLIRVGAGRSATVTILGLVLLAGALRWTIAVQSASNQPLRDLCRDQSVTVEVSGRIQSVPVAHRRPTSELSPHVYGSTRQTRFSLQVQAVHLPQQTIAVSGLCRVYVDGDAAARLSSADVVRLTGKLDWPQAPGNPGEFNFPEYLRRHNVAALLYVAHPLAIEVVRPAQITSPGYWLTALRHRAQTVLQQHLHGPPRPVALALLLGDRHELTSETETAFVSSGAMHLLAISGLHVGILCLFLMRLLHWLLVPWTGALLLTAGVCVLYALVTDLRPSVVRATVFFLLFVAGQLCRREVSTASLLSVTALLMLCWQPQLVFDTGAWLSFLSVAALGWVAARSPTAIGDRAAPPDALTFTERLREGGRVLSDRLVRRYRQMLCILVLTTPLVAAAFHVLSPVGLLINVLLIPFTAIVLVLGFLLLFGGFLLPLVAPVFAVLFQAGLNTLLTIVELASHWQLGHVYIADLPAWLVPVFYGLLLLAVTAAAAPFRKLAAAGVLAAVTVALLRNGQPPEVSGIRCTVLDVGHGSACAVEAGHGRVFLVDAGAMNRGERAADVICRFLWSRGYRAVDGILISHADADHYNALAGIMSRLPVGELRLTQDFLQHPGAGAAAVRQLALAENVPVRVAVSGDVCRIGSARLTVLQTDLSTLPDDVEDNQKSLVVLVDQAGRRICLPGDVEGPALSAILPRLTNLDVLVSPHHGSRTANTPQLADMADAQYVIVSARDTRLQPLLTDVYADSRVLFTSEAGAVSISVDDAGTLTVDPYRR